MKRYRTFPFVDKIYEAFAPKAEGLETDTIRIVNLIKGCEPCMISRFGSTELQTLWYSRFFPMSLPLKSRTYYNIQNASGFFPVTHESLKRFYKEYKEDVKEMDLLVSWRVEELFFKDWIGKKQMIRKTSMDTFYSQERPWTAALEGQRVLVVHPFAETVERQYDKSRDKLYANPLVLPEFASLQTVKAVQSIAGEKVQYANWFEALDYMKLEIDKKDFDIALIGCGAYGLPLAAHIKRMGKKSVHMGGVIQFLFGIKGKRYVDNPLYSKYINEYFVYPPDADRPQNSKVVEGGCYW